MSTEIEWHILPEDWLDELERMAQQHLSSFESQADKFLEYKFDHHIAKKYVLTVAKNDEIRTPFLTFYRWLDKWMNSEEGKFGIYTEARDCPRDHHRTILFFKSWFKLKDGLSGLSALRFIDLTYNCYLIIEKYDDATLLSQIDAELDKLSFVKAGDV